MPTNATRPRNRPNLNTTMDPALLDRLRERAVEERRTMSAVIEMAVEQYLIRPLEPAS